MYKITGISLLVLLNSFSSFSYRFICNGYLADGEMRRDECGVCDEENAARWKNPNLPVAVDKSTLPPGITGFDWDEIVTTSFAAWENVSGADLRFFAVDAENPRDFGANDSLHEIFWITDVEEWRRLVGSGEFGTLGATLPRYICGGNLGSKRVIFDADLVLNGMPYINWQVNCDSSDCISVQTTLVHELGHFAGLDHPCLLCSTSVMSARAGFDISNPVFDDMQGLRVLYPSANRGKFGDSCNSNKDCTSEYSCFKDGKNQYCSHECRKDEDCEQGSVCLTDNFCAFRSGASAGGLLEGEICNNSPCAEPFVCAGAAIDQYSCFKPCETNDECQANQTCVRLDPDVSLCVEIKKENETCTMRALCEDGLYCVFGDNNLGNCRQGCARTSPHCKTGDECQRFEGGKQVCVPRTSELNLDLGSKDFIETSKEGSLGRSKKSPEISAPDLKPSGCRTNDFDPGHYPFLFALVVFFMCQHWRSRKAL